MQDNEGEEQDTDEENGLLRDLKVIASNCKER